MFCIIDGMPLTIMEDVWEDAIVFRFGRMLLCLYPFCGQEDRFLSYPPGLLQQIQLVIIQFSLITSLVRSGLCFHPLEIILFFVLCLHSILIK